ncbi:MAG: TetR/AcrR family transcriptional regulator [Eubacteriales bacterium]
MNKANNKRRKDSRNRIETAFVREIQEKEINKITVTDICNKAGVNRTTFYANYIDIYDLADTVKKRLEDEINELYRDEREKKYNSLDFLKLFRHIKENMLFYKTYFKLGMDGKFSVTEWDSTLAGKRFGGENIDYHIEFFRYGLNAVIKKWLKNDCAESPEEIFSVIRSEYSGKPE